MPTLKQNPIISELHSLLGFWPPLEVLMSAAILRPVIDFAALDNILKIYWKAEYPDTISQDEFILKKFGDRTLELLNQAI